MDEQNASMSLSEGSNSTIETNTSVDNSADSTEYSQEDIASALEEPTNEEPNDTKGEVDNDPQEPPSDSKDNTPATEYPVKFQNKDGSLDVEKLLKSYKELEPLLSEKAAWQKERAEREQAAKAQQEAKEQEAKEAGFESALDMQQYLELVNVEANEYARYLQYTENPEAVRKMLIDYINSPSEQALEDIMLEFPPSVIARVSVVKDRTEQGFKAEQANYKQTQMLTNIEDVIAQSVNSKNGDLFNHDSFRNLFERTLQKYGDNFTYEDAQLLMDCISELKNAWYNEYIQKSEVNSQNKEAIDKLASISSNNSAPAASQARNLDSLSQKELAREIRKYI